MIANSKPTSLIRLENPVITCQFVTSCVLSLTAKAQVFVEKGNVQYKKKKFKNAAELYTRGILVKCKDHKMNIILYLSRACSYSALGEFT